MQFYLCISAIQQQLCLLDDEMNYLSKASMILNDVHRTTIKDECSKELVREIKRHMDYVDKHIGWVKNRRQFLESIIELGVRFTFSEDNPFNQLNKYSEIDWFDE